MPRGTTLENALLMLKGELGGITTTTGGDIELYTYLDMVQTWLATEWDWPFMEVRADVDIEPNTRYYVTPTTVSFDRPVPVTVFWNNQWLPVEFGINENQYNIFPSGDGGLEPVMQSPVQRWAWNPNDLSKIEVWPLPNEDQTLRFTGQKPIPTLKTAGVYDPAATLILDDILVVKFAAAQKLARMEKADAKIVLAQAETRLNRLRATQQNKFERPLILGTFEDRVKKKRAIPIIVSSAAAGLVMQGTGEPEGVVGAPVGRMYFRTDEPQSLWLKTDGGTGNTGWQPLIET